MRGWGLRAVWARLAGRRKRGAGEAAAGRPPAVPIEQSVTPNFLICLETGTRQVALKRHLRQTLRMTPEEYRARWGLPAEYPMVAESYGSRRKSVQNMLAARKSGLAGGAVGSFQEQFRPVIE